MNNIFDIIKKNKNKKFDEVCEDSKVSPYLIMRWLYGTHNSKQILLVNNICNFFQSKFYYHKKLSYMLESVATYDMKLKWIKPKAQSKKNDKIDIICSYYSCSRMKALDYLPILSDNDIAEIREELGYE